MTKTVFFFRKPFPGYHSIEELFNNIIRHLPIDIEPTLHLSKYHSNGLLPRIFNLVEARFFQQEINHITGDIHYIAYLLKKQKTILTIHDLEIIKRNHFIKRYLILFFWFYIPIKRVKYVTVISTFTKQELMRYISVPEYKIKVIPNCIPGNIDFYPKLFASECPTILQVGTKPNKNIFSLIEAIKNIPCKLIVLGELSSEQIALLKWNHIDYENYFDLAYQEVIEIYKKADLLTFISTYEGFGLPILEAQAVGRPVITSNLSSMPEVAGNAALLVDPYNVKEIRAGIIKIINDAQLREQLITYGLENIKRFTPEVVAEEYAKLYREIKGNNL